MKSYHRQQFLLGTPCLGYILSVQRVTSPSAVLQQGDRTKRRQEAGSFCHDRVTSTEYCASELPLTLPDYIM